MQSLRRPRNWLGLIAKIFCGLAIFYILIYMILSKNGRYAFAMADIGRLEGFSWAPAGLYIKPSDEYQKDWDVCLLYAFYPLWSFDCAHFHTGKDAYITDDQVQFWLKQRQPNDFIHLARQLPPTVLTPYIIGVLGTPNRTNSMANGSIRWEYDYQSTNGLVYGSLFFNPHGIFEGSSTNANAQTADFN